MSNMWSLLTKMKDVQTYHHPTKSTYTYVSHIFKWRHAYTR